MADNLGTGKTFQFELVSPEAVLSSEPATMVVVPGEAGDFGVLADHAPLLSSLRPGVVEIHSETGKRRVFVAGGFADVGNNACSVLAEEAVPVEKMNASDLEQALKNLTEDKGVATDPLEKAKIEAKIGIVRAKIQAVNAAA